MKKSVLVFISLFLVPAVAALAALPAYAADPGTIVNVPVSFLPLSLSGIFEYYSYDGYVNVPVSAVTNSEDYNEQVNTPGMGIRSYRSVTFEVPDIYYSASIDDNAYYALHARFSIGSTDDLVLSSPVQHIEWIFYYQVPGYTSGLSHEFIVMSVTGYDYSSDSPGTYNFQVRSLDNHADNEGREFYQAYGVSGTESGVILADFDLIDFTLWFRGYPNAHYASIGFAESCNVDVLVTDPSSGMDDEVYQIGSTADQIADDLSVNAPNVSGYGSTIASNLTNSELLPYLTPPSNSAFFRSLTTVAVSSLSVCLLGYILYGKKG